ncbi:MAG: cell division protein ZapA [Lachnospiraceae bacterium]|nr:cell division protein ZapA [Lachnospiraceae bacterium]
MSSKTDTQVVIGGRMYTVSGYESEAYLQQVAAYLNNKLAEFDQMEGFRRQSIDLQHFLIQLNLADDYFQVKKQTESLEDQLAEKEKELYDIKHELITTQMKLETTEGSVEQLKQELEDRDRRIIRMEAEMRSSRPQ